MLKFKSLTTKLIFMGIIMLTFVAVYIIATFIFTNQISDNALRINLAGSLRSRSFEMTWIINKIIKTADPGLKESLTAELRNEINMYERIADNIKNGNRELGIRALKNKDEIMMFDGFLDEWNKTLKPLLLEITKLHGKRTGILLDKYNVGIQNYAYGINRFVGLLEAEHKTKLEDFNAFRFYIFGLFFITTVFIIFYARHDVIKPTNSLKNGVKEIADGNFDVRVDIRSKDEIGELSGAFNKMAEAINERDREKNILFKQIKRSHEQWQNTFDSITDLISIHDKEFNIVKANRAFMEYFGLTHEEMTSKKCYEFFHGTDLYAENCPHLITLNENRPETAEIINIKTSRIFRISTFPFYFPESDFKGSIHIARDITEEKEKEMQLIMSDRLAALGQMASGIAHEINNPLASIAGCAEGLLSRVKTNRFDPVLFESYLKIIEEEISRCKKITTDMLSFVREKTYEKKEINLNESLDKTLEIIGFQGRLKGITVIKNYAKAIPVVHASEGELRQAFIAIITNALDAMQDNGTLTLETGIEDNMIFIKISDSGTGIQSEHIDRIFAHFFTTKAEKGGTGLGLSIARKIITDNNGSIHVTSEIGKGTTFKIALRI
ncbi:MAG: ATP-binding protein [Thermodesulfovibrionales bacterium]